MPFNVYELSEQQQERMTAAAGVAGVLLGVFNWVCVGKDYESGVYGPLTHVQAVLSTAILAGGLYLLRRAKFRKLNETITSLPVLATASFVMSAIGGGIGFYDYIHYGLGKGEDVHWQTYGKMLVGTLLFLFSAALGTALCSTSREETDRQGNIQTRRRRAYANVVDSPRGGYQPPVAAILVGGSSSPHPTR